MKTGRPHMIPVGYVRPQHSRFQPSRPLSNSALVVRRPISQHPTSARKNSSRYSGMSTMGTWTYDGDTLWLRDGDLMWGRYTLSSRKVFDPSEAVPSANDWQVSKALAAVEAGLTAQLNITDMSQVEAAVALYRAIKAVQSPSPSAAPAPAPAPAPTTPRTTGSSSSGSRPPAAPAPAPEPEKTPITQQPWFLPVVVGGSVLVIGVVVIAATGKSKQAPVPAAAN